ncbi:deoxyribodipyrimidine photo-lyase [Bradyrhizobium diazoefficiens]|nr:deoxyribodipyrimidine photo-lyase [Bradyrhizobium diazoefficiens]MBR0815414.1 deoxyribodipyrimidine photo-lyase [Bradyrhizobium diazoefficiens]
MVSKSQTRPSLTTPSAPPIIVWFRDDLRLSDHPALHAAAKTGAPVLCLFVLDDGVGRPPGAATRWWLAQSLRALAAEIAARGGALVLRRGPAARVIPEVAQESGARAVYWNGIAQAPHQAIERQLGAALARLGVDSQSFPGDLLVPPSAIRTKEGRGLRVFTPFWRRVLALGDPPKPLSAPKELRPAATIAGDGLESWRLEPTKPDWAGGLRESWTPGEASARRRLRDFLKHSALRYVGDRDRPDRDGTSGLSPHLRFGELSPRQVWHAARFAADEDPALGPGIEKFLSELGWREFCRHLLHDHPDLATENLQANFDGFPWTPDQKALAAWQRGRTGYPIVDAGLRELWHTGVMHNRVRMVVASFLVKHLLIDWREGEAWFWDTLVDADAGSNPANWQWVAGCGADAAPYFRVFNPQLQGEKFDPDGTYVRAWVPELKDLPVKLIHQPWRATPIELASAGIIPGKTYPQPIVDHARGRERALAAYAKIRKG